MEIPCFYYILPRGGELGVLRVHEHPLSMQAHPLIAKSYPFKMKRKCNETPFDTDIQQIYGDFDVNIRVMFG